MLYQSGWVLVFVCCCCHSYDQAIQEVADGEAKREAADKELKQVSAVVVVVLVPTQQFLLQAIEAF